MQPGRVLLSIGCVSRAYVGLAYNIICYFADCMYSNYFVYVRDGFHFPFPADGDIYNGKIYIALLRQI